MGMELRLLPLDHYSRTADTQGSRGFGYSHSIINLKGNVSSDFWREMKALPSVALDEHDDVTSFVGGHVPDGPDEGEPCYGRLVKDPYGDPYGHVRAADLSKVLTDHYPRSPVTAYVRALDPEARVVLGWH